jgi:hypothetical protein
MSGQKIAGIIVLVLGALSLAYGGFSYTSGRSHMDLGPLSVQVEERDRVNVPIWLGVALVVVGGGLLAGVGRGK